ncbi:MAG: hypothetical protein Q7J15_08160 [Candidatus Desulfaltia sp.]|nr:hypothetical protein [Candidatus Desulfaltia sp.]
MKKFFGSFVFISLLVFGVYFLEKGKLGAASFVSFISVVLISGFAFYGFDRIKELDIKNLRLILSEIKETKAEIFAKQDDLKKTAFVMSEILAFSSADNGRMDSKEGYRIKREWYDHKLNELMNDFDFSDKEIQEIKKFSAKYNEIDRLLQDRDVLKVSDPDYKEIKTKLESLSSEIKRMQQEDTKKDR